MNVLILTLITVGVVCGQQFNSINVINFIESGFDARKSLFGLAQMIDFSYDSNQVWISPYSNTKFSVPDEISLHTMEEIIEIMEKIIEIINDASIK